MFKKKILKIRNATRVTGKDMSKTNESSSTEKMKEVSWEGTNRKDENDENKERYAKTKPYRFSKI